MKKAILLTTLLLLIFSTTLSWASLKEDRVTSFRIDKEKVISSYSKEIPKGFEPKRIEHPVDAKKSPVSKSTPSTRGGRIAGDLLWEDNFESTADLFYGVSFSYGWGLPDGYGTTMYGMRFTPTLDGVIDQAYFYFYGAWSTGAPDLRVYVWDDNAGLPGTELGYVDVPFASLVFDDWCYVDFSSLSIAVTEGTDFFIGYEVTNGVAGTTDIAIISDDGSAGEQRAVDYYLGAWETFASWTVDCNLWIGAIINKDPLPDPWTDSSGEWQFVEITSRADPQSPDAAHSPTHCWWVDEDSTFAPKSQLVSPWMTLPSSHTKLFLQFWYFNNLIDWDGDDDGTLEDYFKVYVADDTCAWHTSTHNAFSGNSWWCGAEDYDLYGTYEMYHLTSPEIDLGVRAGGTLTFKTAYEIETSGGEPPGFDAWDVCNVQISENGGIDWDFLIPTTPSYDADSAYAYYVNTGQTGYYPGWYGSSGGWIDASFDISAYTGNIILRWALASDPAATFEGFFIDNVVVTDDTRATVFEDDADTEVHLIPDAAVPFVGDELTYDYWQDGDTLWVLEDDNQIWNGSLDISAWIGDDVQILIEVINDYDHNGGEGEGFWVDDVQLIGSNLPEHDTQCDFLLVPYPTTEGMVDFPHPKMLYHQAGYGTSGANGSCDVDLTGNAYPLYDFRENNMGDLSMDEYALVELTIQMPQYVPAEGTWDYIGWCDGADEGRADSFAPDTIAVDIYPPNEYELGYNSRIWDEVYYTSTKCGTYFTPFTDGIFTRRDYAYVITDVELLLINYGVDNGTETQTIEIFEAIDDVTPGALIYSESFAYTAGLGGTYEWAVFDLTTDVTITDDFFIIISGDWWDPGTGDIVPLFDNMIRDKMGSGAYTDHSVYWTGTEYAHSSGDRFINAIVEYAFYLTTPANITIEISGNDVVLDWDDVSGATGYNIYRSTDPYSFGAVYDTSATSDYTDTGAAAGTKYYYQVTATAP